MYVRCVRADVLDMKKDSYVVEVGESQMPRPN